MVITGSGSGMGRAYAIEFARLKARLALCDCDEQLLQDTVSITQAISDQPVFYKVVDVSDKAQIFQFAEDVKSQIGNAHIVINNAGVETQFKPAWALEDASTERIMDINFYGVMYGTQAFLPQLQENTEAALVNVSSLFGLIGAPNHADYCASKFAVRGYTEALITELTDSHIQVHLLCPGGVKTNILKRERSKKFADHFLSTPPEEIARALIQAIVKNKSRIVCGNRAKTSWLAARLLPLKLLSRITWHQTKHFIDRSDYQSTRESGA